MARQPLSTLLALTALVSTPLAAPLVLAQATPEAGEAAAPAPAAAPQPPPPLEAVPQAPAAVRETPSPSAAVAPPAPEPARTPPPAVRVQASPTPLSPPAETAGSGAGALRPGPSEQRLSPAPRRFDHSLDALIRDGVVTPNEVRVRVHPGLIRNPDLLRQGCSSGAFSARECGSAGGDAAVVFRGRYGEGAAGSIRAGGGGSGERYGIDAAPLPPIAVPVTALLSGIGGSFRLTDVFGVTPRPQAIAGNGNRSLIFPLIGSAETSSGFGWRLHPILGTWLMHSGRDLAAPEGTPVVAALSGRVVSSGDAGGYGLAIEIEHERPLRRTLYGHLSELYVKEGDRVRQGEVIGRVGSTGRSTGPHLHFEVRMPQEGGWVAIDPGNLDNGGTQLAGGLQGLAALAGLNGTAGGPPPDAIALLMGQLLQSLERPRSPLGTAAAAAGGEPARPLSTERLPRPLPPTASLPAPAPLPRNPRTGATPGL